LHFPPLMLAIKGLAGRPELPIIYLRINSRELLKETSEQHGSLCTGQDAMHGFEVKVVGSRLLYRDCCRLSSKRFPYGVHSRDSRIMFLQVAAVHDSPGVLDSSRNCTLQRSEVDGDRGGRLAYRNYLSINSRDLLKESEILMYLL